MSAAWLYRVSIGGGSAPAHAGVPVGISDSCADVVRRRRPHVTGESQGAAAGDRVRAPAPGWAFRLVFGLRFIESFRHVGKSSLVRCPDIFTGFPLTGGQPQCHRHRRPEGTEPWVRQYGRSVKPVQKQKRRPADHWRAKVDDWRDHKLPERIQAMTGRS